MPSDVITAVEEEEGGGVFRERKGDPCLTNAKKTIGAFSLYERYSSEKKEVNGFPRFTSHTRERVGGGGGGVTDAGGERFWHEVVQGAL